MVKQTQQSLAHREITYFKLNELFCVQHTHLVVHPFESSLPDVSSKLCSILKGIAASYYGDYNQSNTNSTSSKTQNVIIY